MRAERRPAKRPFGVAVIALLLLSNGLLSLVQLAYELRQCAGEHSGRVSVTMFVDSCSQLSGVNWATLPFTLIGIALAWGLWTLRPRMWTYTMFVQGVFLVVQLYDYFQGEPVFLNLTVSVFTVLYLNQSDVQLVFRGRQASSKGQEARSR